MEEAYVEALENLIQIVVLPERAQHLLAAAGLANQLCLAHHRFARSKTPIAGGERRIERLAIKLGQQDMRNGTQHAFGRAFQQVRQMHMHAPIAQTNGGVQAGKAAKANF